MIWLMRSVKNNSVYDIPDIGFHADQVVSTWSEDAVEEGQTHRFSGSLFIFRFLFVLFVGFFVFIFVFSGPMVANFGF